MANPRQDERQNLHEARRVAEDTARAGQEQAGRMGRVALEAGENATRAGSEAMQRNADAFRQIWQSGLELTKQMTERSADQFARTFGLSGDGAQRAAEQSSRNVEAMLSSGSVFAQTLQDMSLEWMDFSRQRMEHNLQQINNLMRCRTPQEFLATQSEAMRDNFESLMNSGRKVAEMSMRMAEESGRKMAEGARRAAA